MLILIVFRPIGAVSSCSSPAAETSEKYLVRLHSQLIRSLQAYHRTQAQWERIVARALDLEDEVANLGNADRNFLRSTRKIRDSRTYLGWMIIINVS